MFASLLNYLKLSIYLFFEYVFFLFQLLVLILIQYGIVIRVCVNWLPLSSPFLVNFQVSDSRLLGGTLSRNFTPGKATKRVSGIVNFNIPYRVRFVSKLRVLRLCQH